MTHRMLGPALLIVFACWGMGPMGTTVADEAVSERPHVVLVSYEDEYKAAESLALFARLLSDRYGCRCSVLQGAKETGFLGLENLATADVLVLYAKRHALPQEQMDMIRRYLDAGRPLVALRTASHAFDIKAEPPDGMATWPTFDRDVLGGNYHDHYRAGPRTRITAADGAMEHPILSGICFSDWTSSASLYKNSPLGSGPTVLLIGGSEGHTEPIAWTHRYHDGRVFYTSLGNTGDFETPQFQTLLVGAIYWAMNESVPRKL